MIRYPLAPLIEAMHLSPNQACLALGLSGSTQQEYRERGVTERVADRLAVKAGLVPYEVWPEMVEDQIASVEVVCARHDCDGTFIPVRRDQVACSPGCAEAIRNRRRRRRPEVAAADRDRAARYYAANAEYVRTERRRRYHAPAPVPCTQETQQ